MSLALTADKHCFVAFRVEHSKYLVVTIKILFTTENHYAAFAKSSFFKLQNTANQGSTIISPMWATTRLSKVPTGYY